MKTFKQIDVQQIVFPAVDRVTLESAQQHFKLGPDDVLLQTQYSLVSAGTELAKLAGLQQVTVPYSSGGKTSGST